MMSETEKETGGRYYNSDIKQNKNVLGIVNYQNQDHNRNEKKFFSKRERSYNLRNIDIFVVLAEGDQYEEPHKRDE